jgi:hypothetical protein
MRNPPWDSQTARFAALRSSSHKADGMWWSRVPLGLGIIAVVCSGCAYFVKTPAEEKQRHEEQDEINKLYFKPGTTFYTR